MFVARIANSPAFPLINSSAVLRDKFRAFEAQHDPGSPRTCEANGNRDFPRTGHECAWHHRLDFADRARLDRFPSLTEADSEHIAHIPASSVGWVFPSLVARAASRIASSHQRPLSTGPTDHGVVEVGLKFTRESLRPLVNQGPNLTKSRSKNIHLALDDASFGLIEPRNEVIVHELQKEVEHFSRASFDSDHRVHESVVLEPIALLPKMGDVPLVLWRDLDALVTKSLNDVLHVAAIEVAPPIGVFVGVFDLSENESPVEGNQAGLKEHFSGRLKVENCVLQVSRVGAAVE